MIRACDMMTIAMARLIHDGDTVFHGVSSHMPMIAVLAAKRLHAPNAVHLNIPGGVDPEKPTLREFTSAGGELWQDACAGFPLMEVFDLSMRGGLDVAFLSGVQFDARGNVNASVIGDYRKPKVRLPGGAGSAVLDLEDYLVSNILLPGGSLVYLFFCISRVGWGFKNYQAEANQGKGLKVPGWIRGYVTYVLPVIVGLLFIKSIFRW